MKFWNGILVLLLVTAAVPFRLVLVGEPTAESANGLSSLHGVEHPRFGAGHPAGHRNSETAATTRTIGKGMLRGGTPERHRSMFWQAMVYGCGMMIVSAMLLTLGLTTRTARIVLMAAAVVYVGSFVGLMRAYAEETANSTPQLIGSLPPSAAWLVYGIWSTPVLFILIYVLRFRAWFYPPAAQERFEQLLQQRRSATATTPGEASA